MSATAHGPRVVHVVPALFGHSGVVGGAERYACELARHMAEAVPTTLVGFGDADREEWRGPLRVRTLAAWHVRGQRSNPFSLAVLRELAGADVVHCHQQHVLVSSVAAAWCRLPVVACSSAISAAAAGTCRPTCRPIAWFHGHLHLSEYSRQVFGHADLGNARVIGGGVDTARFSPAPSVAARRRGAVRRAGCCRTRASSDLVAGVPSGVGADPRRSAAETPPRSPRLRRRRGART